MEEQNLYILHFLNWQSRINICGNNNNNDDNKKYAKRNKIKLKTFRTQKTL